MKKLNAINKRIAKLTKKRNDLLRELRLTCKHLQLVELEHSCAYSSAPPMRICIDCGAEERGWYCGYHVLALSNEITNTPHSKNRVIIKHTSSREEFYKYRKSGPLYLVGQSHPNFEGGGFKTYKQLTAI